MSEADVVGPVFGRTSTPVRKPRATGLRRVNKVVGAVTDAPLELVHGTERTELPEELADLLRIAVRGFEAGEALTLVVGVAQANKELSSQEVADVLNVSRPHVVKLARDGVLPHRLVGNRHRFLLQDVVAYQQVAQGERRAALAALVPAGGYQKGDL